MLQGFPLEAYRNSFANLAVPIFALAEPIAPKKVCPPMPSFNMNSDDILTIF